MNASRPHPAITLPVVAFAALLTAAASEGPQAVNLGRGAVFTTSNEPALDVVHVYRRAPSGRLTPAGRYTTGGTGDGTVSDALASPGRLVLAGGYLFALNTGSDDIAVLRVDRKRLHYLRTVGTGGSEPRSLAVHGDLLYVLHAGSKDISGFRIGGHGELTPLAGSTRSLSAGDAANPAHIAFTPDGAALVVSDLESDDLDVFPLDDHDRPVTPRTFRDSGSNPFGVAFDSRGHLLVAEGTGGEDGGGALSSYQLAEDGMASPISDSVGNRQEGTCCVAVFGRHAYVASSASGTISSYRVARSGGVTLQQAVAAFTGGHPVDLASAGGFLHVLVDTTGAIATFAIEDDGSLTAVQSLRGLPPFAQGIAAQ